MPRGKDKLPELGLASMLWVLRTELRSLGFAAFYLDAQHLTYGEAET